MPVVITPTNVIGAQSGPNVPAFLLDANFNQLASALGASSTFAAYYADAGTVNNLVIGTIAGYTYTPGTWFDVLVGNTNTAGPTLNVNSLGPKTIVNAPAYSLVAGVIYRLLYDGTNFRVLNQTNTNFVFNVTPVGISSPGSAQIYYQLNGTNVTLKCLSGCAGPSTSTSFVINGLPAIISPLTCGALVTSVINNGVGFTALCYPSGTSLTFYDATGNGSGFSASGNKGIPVNWQFQYSL